MRTLAGVSLGWLGIAPEKGGIRMKQGTGAVWRITRDPSVAPGVLPPPATHVPFYPIQAGVVLALIGGGVALVVALVRRLFRR